MHSHSIFTNCGSGMKVTTDVTRQRLEADKWHRDCFLGRFGKEWPLDYLVTECTATILGGVIDPSNAFQYGIFRLCEDKALQERISQEIDTVWQRGSNDIPETRVLKDLGLLVSQTYYFNGIEIQADILGVDWAHLRKPPLDTWYSGWTSTDRSSPWIRAWRSTSSTRNKCDDFLILSTHECCCILRSGSIHTFSLDQRPARNDEINICLFKRQTAVPC